MRTIAFRAWDTKNKRMEYKPQIAVPLNPFPLNDIFFQLDIVWMQSTGLSDRNGKEIYEGDVVKYFPCSGSERQATVEWATYGTGWEPFTSCGTCGDVPHQKHTEVIGNIYENPDLLSA